MFCGSSIDSVYSKTGRDISNKSLDLSNWDTQKVKSIEQMFWMSGFEQIDLSNWEEEINFLFFVVFDSACISLESHSR